MSLLRCRSPLASNCENFPFMLRQSSFSHSNNSDSNILSPTSASSLNGDRPRTIERRMSEELPNDSRLLTPTSSFKLRTERPAVIERRMSKELSDTSRLLSPTKSSRGRDVSPSPMDREHINGSLQKSQNHSSSDVNFRLLKPTIATLASHWLNAKKFSSSSSQSTGRSQSAGRLTGSRYTTTPPHQPSYRSAAVSDFRVKHSKLQDPADIKVVVNRLFSEDTQITTSTKGGEITTIDGSVLVSSENGI